MGPTPGPAPSGWCGCPWGQRDSPEIQGALAALGRQAGGCLQPGGIVCFAAWLQMAELLDGSFANYEKVPWDKVSVKL